MPIFYMAISKFHCTMGVELTCMSPGISQLQLSVRAAYVTVNHLSVLCFGLWFKLVADAVIT